MFDKIKEIYIGLYIALSSVNSEIVVGVMLLLLMGFLRYVGSR